METKKRIEVIDQIRGFAMFGVLLVNITMMEDIFQIQSIETTGAINIFFEKVINLFAVGKFYTLFSLLFGLGFYFFMEKQGEQSQIERRFKRRLKFLLFMGLLHLVFGWLGDILHVYAIGGFFLISKQKIPAESLLKRSVVLFFISVVLITVLSFLSVGSEPTQMPVISNYDETHYLSVITNRVVNEFPVLIINLLVVLPRILSLFYMGYYIGKRGLLNNLPENLPYVNKIFLIMGGIFLFLTGIRLVFSDAFIIDTLAMELSTLAGALTYGSGIIKLHMNLKYGKILAFLNAPGKMALTNYLIQTLFWTFILYGYGLDFGGKIPYALYLPLALLFYGFQIGMCNIWMRYFKQGPMEWLWRYFTYRDKVKNL